MADWLRGEGKKCIRDLDYSNKFRAFDDSPRDALNILGMALYLALFEDKPSLPNSLEDFVPAPGRRIEARILDYDVSAMKHIKANAINKYLSVHGTVVRVR